MKPPQRVLCFLMSHINAVSSYRSELEGIFRCLSHIEHSGMTPTEVEHWCDNERSVISSTLPPSTPSKMITADADLVLAIHRIKASLTMPVHCRHMYEHQDTKKRKDKEKKETEEKSKSKVANQIDINRSKPSDAIAEQFHCTNTSTPEETHDDESSSSSSDSDSDTEDEEDDDKTSRKPLTTEAMINVGCDLHASAVTEAAITDNLTDPGPVMTLPYKGSKAMLKIGDTWITSKYKRAIYKARRLGPIREYCVQRYEWNEGQFDTVDWESIGRVRKKLTVNKFRQSCKLMHGWIPVMHKRQHITGIKQCPGCSQPDETVEHVFRCPNPLMKKRRKEIVADLRKKRGKNKIPKSAMGILIDMVSHVFQGKRLFDSSKYDGRQQKVIASQQAIGLHLLPRGYVSTEWYTHLKFLGVSNPKRRVDSMLKMIWHDIFDPLWDQRNRILHDETNKYNVAEDKALSTRLTWYVRNKHSLLAYQDHFLANHDVNNLHRMRRATKREWIRHLDKAKLAYENERRQRASSQNVIIRYYRSTTSTAVGAPGTLAPD